MKLAEVVNEQRRPAGRSTVTVRCPYCGCETEARLWSIAGSGKRCECGAVLRRYNATGDVIARPGIGRFRAMSSRTITYNWKCWRCGYTITGFEDFEDVGRMASAHVDRHRRTHTGAMIIPVNAIIPDGQCIMDFFVGLLVGELQEGDITFETWNRAAWIALEFWRTTRDADDAED